MGRKESRLRAALEKDPIRECGRIQRKFVPRLFQLFRDVRDPRDPRYTTYSNTVMLGQMYYKGIAGIVGMQEMTREFNSDTATGNIYTLLGEQPEEMLPHHVTENEYLERLDPGELRGILHEIVYDSIRGKRFNDARFHKKWIVIIDGTQGYSGSRRLNGTCLERHYNRGTENEAVNYHCDVLEAKLYLGPGLLLSIGSEFMENGPGPGGGHTKTHGEREKQDCEIKAFRRLASNLKKEYPRLPMLLMMDGLYAGETVFSICRENGWDYIVRYKDGSIPSIAEEYAAIPEKEKAGRAEFVNYIDYKGHTVNMLRYYETATRAGREVRTDFQFLTSLSLTKGNAEKTAGAGRLRWKTGNQGFNRQKNWSGDITHACSHNANALKCHYLITQISDFVRQLYEWHFLKKNGIVKTHKNISSDFLNALTKQQTKREDISVAEAMPAFC